MKQGIAKGLNYPFLTYARNLQSDITQLSEAIRISDRYPLLQNKCANLEQAMSDALGIVVNFPDYMNEIHLKRQHDLEQERIENERRRVEAERARVRIEQERMERQKAKERAEQIASVVSAVSSVLEKAKADAEKAKAEADKARLEKERRELEKEKARLETEKERMKKEQQSPRPPAYNPESQKPQKLYPDLDDYFNPNPAPSAPPMDDQD